MWYWRHGFSINFSKSDVKELVNVSKKLLLKELNTEIQYETGPRVSLKLVFYGKSKNSFLKLLTCILFTSFVQQNGSRKQVLDESPLRTNEFPLVPVAVCRTIYQNSVESPRWNKACPNPWVHPPWIYSKCALLKASEITNPLGLSHPFKFHETEPFYRLENGHKLKPWRQTIRTRPHGSFDTVHCHRVGV